MSLPPLYFILTIIPWQRQNRCYLSLTDQNTETEKGQIYHSRRKTFSGLQEGYLWFGRWIKKNNVYILISVIFQAPLSLSLFFWLHHMASRILVPWPAIEPRPSAVKAPSPNHWTDSPQVPLKPCQRWTENRY